MDKFMNGLCLGIWIFQFVFGVAAACGKVNVSPYCFYMCNINLHFTLYGKNCLST